MVAARTAARGLTPADLDGIRETVAAGRRRKVLCTEPAGQVAGQVGQVVQLGDPSGSEDFVLVRFGRDELPFSPADLAIPARGAAGRRPKAANGKPADEAKPAPELRPTQPPVPAPREGEPAGQPPEQPATPVAAPRKATPAQAAQPPAPVAGTLGYTP